jgi:DNA-binding transcriptional LysR family regulator
MPMLRSGAPKSARVIHEIPPVRRYVGFDPFEFRPSVRGPSEPDPRVPIPVNGAPAYSQLVARGYGVGLLTCSESDALPDLSRLSGATPLIVREIWLLVLSELRRNATVCKVLDWIATITKGGAATLSGSSGLKQP